MLIIIDTLQMIRGANYENTYANDYTRMIEKREAEADTLRERIKELENLSETIRKKQTSIKRDVSMIDDILASDGISEAQLRLLIDCIKIYDTANGLDVQIVIKAPFRTHYEEFGENGEIVDSAASLGFDFDRLAPILFDDISEWITVKEVS